MIGTLGQPGPLDWIGDKTAISAWTGLSDDALHVHLGLFILFAVGAMLRRRPWSLLPWLVLLALEVANEAYDMLQTRYFTDEGNWLGSWHDFWMTMLWPTVLLIVVPWLTGNRPTRNVRPDEPY